MSLFLIFTLRTEKLGVQSSTRKRISTFEHTKTLSWKHPEKPWLKYQIFKEKVSCALQGGTGSKQDIKCALVVESFFVEAYRPKSTGSKRPLVLHSKETKRERKRERDRLTNGKHLSVFLEHYSREKVNQHHDGGWILRQRTSHGVSGSQSINWETSFVT